MKYKRESGVLTSAVDGECEVYLPPPCIPQSPKGVKKASHLGRLRQGEREN